MKKIRSTNFLIILYLLLNGINGQVFDSVYIEIGFNGLHCPILGPRLKEKIGSDKDIKLFLFDRDSSKIALHYYGDKLKTEEDWQKYIEEIGYHRSYIKVKVISNKRVRDEGNE